MIPHDGDPCNLWFNEEHNGCVDRLSENNYKIMLHLHGQIKKLIMSVDLLGCVICEREGNAHKHQGLKIPVPHCYEEACDVKGMENIFDVG